eukprot:816235-Prorocentrum_minimum.AAC.1
MNACGDTGMWPQRRWGHMQRLCGEPHKLTTPHVATNSRDRKNPQHVSRLPWAAQRARRAGYTVPSGRGSLNVFFVASSLGRLKVKTLLVVDGGLVLLLLGGVVGHGPRLRDAAGALVDAGAAVAVLQVLHDDGARHDAQHHAVERLVREQVPVVAHEAHHRDRLPRVKLPPELALRRRPPQEAAPHHDALRRENAPR